MLSLCVSIFPYFFTLDFIFFNLLQFFLNHLLLLESFELKLLLKFSLILLLLYKLVILFDRFIFLFMFLELILLLSPFPYLLLDFFFSHQLFLLLILLGYLPMCQHLLLHFCILFCIDSYLFIYILQLFLMFLVAWQSQFFIFIYLNGQSTLLQLLLYFLDALIYQILYFGLFANFLSFYLYQFYLVWLLLLIISWTFRHKIILLQLQCIISNKLLKIKGEVICAFEQTQLYEYTARNLAFSSHSDLKYCSHIL